jgi:plastocyanin
MRSWHVVAALAAGLGVMGLGSDRASSAADPAGSGVVAGTVAVTLDGAPKPDRSGVAVYLENVPGGAPPPQTRQMHQLNLSFTPGVMVVTTGTTIEFPNDDKVFHNVFSVSSAARFDLGLYKSGISKSVTFKKPGVIDVYCNIHPQMAAKIKVLDTSYYALTGADGSFRIKGVPAGTYPVVAWQAKGDEYRGEVTVAAGGTAQLSISLVETRAPKRHLRKDGTPYGRYK